MLHPPPPPDSHHKSRLTPAHHYHRHQHAHTLPTPPHGTVKNQGAFGTCWSFAAAENLEGLNARQGNKLENISNQELIDCCKDCQGKYITHYNTRTHTHTHTYTHAHSYTHAPPHTRTHPRACAPTHTIPTPFQNGAKSRDLRCVLHPRAGWVQNSSRIQDETPRNPHFMYALFRALGGRVVQLLGQ